MVAAIVSLSAGAQAVVAGGAGLIGSGVVRAMLKQRAKVIVVGRSFENFLKLHDSIPQQFHSCMTFIQSDLNKPEAAKALFNKTIAEHSCQGAIKHVISCLKSNRVWFPDDTPMLDNPEATMFGAMTEDVTSQFLLMKTFIPYLNAIPGSTYTVITGHPPAGEPPNDPESLFSYPLGPCHNTNAINLFSSQHGYWTRATETEIAKSSPLQILSAGTLHGLLDATRAEFRDSKVAISEVHVNCHVQPEEHLGDYGSRVDDVGNNLIGSAVTAIVAARSRDKVIIRNKADAQRIAKCKQ